MKRSNYFLGKKHFEVLGTVFLGTIAIPLVALAESPLPSTDSYPDSNRITQESGKFPILQSPSPIETTPAITVEPVDGYINIKLINDTNATVSYQVVGDTDARSLYGSSSVNLRRLETPINLSFYRQDGGFLTATAKKSSTPGVLEVTLTEAKNSESYNLALNVEPTGAVYLK